RGPAMSDDQPVSDMLREILSKGFEEMTPGVAGFVRSIAYQFKQTVYVSPNQKTALKRILEIRRQQKADRERGLKVHRIPEDAFQKSAERRKGHPRPRRKFDLKD